MAELDSCCSYPHPSHILVRAYRSQQSSWIVNMGRISLCRTLLTLSALISMGLSIWWMQDVATYSLHPIHFAQSANGITLSTISQGMDVAPSSKATTTESRFHFTIMVIMNEEGFNKYQRNINNLQCYSQMQQYEFVATTISETCANLTRHLMFQRQCVLLGAYGEGSSRNLKHARFPARRTSCVSGVGW